MTTCICPPEGVAHDCPIPTHGLKKDTPVSASGPQQRSLPKQSYKKALLDARWSGVKDGILFMMRRYEEDGKAHCWECGVAGDAGSLEAHHTRSRAQGGSYEARNCEILCSTCHEKATGMVQWSESSAR